MHSNKISTLTQHHVRSLIEPDLKCATDDNDLRQRLAMNGYGFRDHADRRVLVTLPHGVEVLDLPKTPTLH